MSEYSPELGPYNTQVQQASNHTEKLVAGVAGLALGLGTVRQVATGTAADLQQMTAGMAAAATVTHQGTQQLQNSVRGLTRDFPVARGEAVATEKAIQSLGLTAKGQERQVGALAKTMTQLSGATGEAPAQLALGFGQLTREMASLDPKRVQAMADSLTTLSARSGTSPTAITGFAKAIGPMAQAAGAGETSVMGISTSFAKLGDDGYVAANAVSKMFGDLNRSVRDGSNDMAGYANAVGMTIDQFKALYKADPARAVAQVTEAIGKMPSGQGQRTLESLGIEGTRAQRAFLEQAQSGGMMADIQAAREAYGSGSTARAAGAGFNTTQNQLMRLGNAAQDVAVTFERPLLRSVNSIIGVATRITGGIATAARSGPAGEAISVATQAALPLLIARMGARALRTGAMGSFLLRSGPVTGLLAGIRTGRMGGVDEAVADEARTAPVRNMLLAAQSGQALGVGNRAGINARAMNVGSALGAIFPAGGEGPSMFARVRGLGVLGAGMGLRSTSELMRLARTDPLQRDDYLMRTYGSAGRTAAENIKGLADTHGITSPKYIAGMAKEVDNLVIQSSKASTAVGSLSKGIGSLLTQSTLTAGSLTKTVGGGLFRTLMPAVAPMAAIGIGMFGVNQFMHRRDASNSLNTEFKDQDIFSAVNAYRDSMGKTGEASMTLADQLKAASQSVGAVVDSFDQAARVNSQDAAVVQRNKNVMTRYSGNEAQVGSEIQSLALGNLQPSDVQGAKYDLMRLQQQGKLPKNFDINKALANAGTGSTATMDPTMIANLVGGYQAAPGSTQSFTQFLGRSGSRDDQLWSQVGSRNALGVQQAGGIELSKQQRAQLGLLTGALGQEQVNLSSHYGANYATGRTLQDMNRAMADALKHHNADQVVGMERAFTAQLGVNVKGQGVTAADIQRAGGFTGILAQRGVKIGGVGVNDLVNTGTGKATVVEDPVAEMLKSKSMMLSDVFSNFSGDLEKGRKALQDVAQNPGDIEKQRNAAVAIVKSSTDAGMSLGELAKQAAKSTEGMADDDARRKVMAQVIAETTRQMQNSLGGMNMAGQLRTQASYYTSLAQTTGNTPEAQAARAQGVQGATDTLNAERDYMKQRLMAQFQFEIASQRANEDYHRNVGRANEDFNRQQRRQAEDAAKAMYSPYQRIAAQPVWDVQNLLGNEREQVTAMRQQVANIRELKKLGLSQQAIDQLSLYDPTKAQQVQEMVGELKASRGEVGQLNRVAGQRQQVAGQLARMDPSVRRATEDFHTAMSRQAADFATQNKRMREDLANSDRELTGDMTSLQKDMNRILHGQQVDWSHQLTNNLKNTIATIRNITPDLLQAQQDALYTPAITDTTPSTLTIAGQGGAGANPAAGRGVNVAVAASGGIVSKDTLVRLAEAGSKEAIIPLNSQGVDFMAAALREAMNQLRGGGRAFAHQIVQETHVYDQGQHIHGPVTVKANSPAEWANQARQHTRRANMTAPRSVRWGRQAVAA